MVPPRPGPAGGPGRWHVSQTLRDAGRRVSVCRLEYFFYNSIYSHDQTG